MRLKTNATVRRTMYLALGGMLFCPSSSVHAQGMASRAPAGIRSANELSGSNPFDSIALISSKPANVPRTTPLAETVSVKELRVPAPAVKEFQRSLKAIRSGDFQSAAEHLRKAIQIDPDFVQAHDNLGLSYVQLSQYENAVSEFQQAIALDTNVQESHRNLGLGLFLQLNPRSNYARYTLGRILAAEGSGSAEAEQLLRQSIADFPDARLPLAQVMLNKGATEEAVAELRTYLKSPDANPAKKQALQCRLAQMTGSDVNAACGTR